MSPYAASLLEQEARSLQTRLARVRPFALIEPMVPAAALLPSAQAALERYLVTGRRELQALVAAFQHWLAGARDTASASEAQRRFTFLRLKFNATLTQFDLFNDVITQRSEHENGVWLSGLDAVAADALTLPGDYYRLPPVVCYLDRGPGAAIRRARTRLPGGGENPVAVVRVPRERMIGSGIASSLIHEVGHQGAALLDLVNSLRPELQAMQQSDPARREVWQWWERWISEIVADFWSVARVGVVSTLGLIGVVSLPRVFVFRLSPDDPHPIPWIRVMLSCAMGQALYPHPQWERLANVWHDYYPSATLAPETVDLLARLRHGMPAFVALLTRHRPAALRGKSLPDVLDVAARQPAALSALYRRWEGAPAQMYRAPPSLVFAVLGQARADGQVGPEDENVLLAKLLTHWALRSTLDTSFLCASLDARAPALPRAPLTFH
ncbi:hypothetical protein [Massilia scottii]|uniref:hypothetical protein n=1 Tax=Massilia scottii TaxID=3057166 RepID=UPI0027968542|nr:hypothetical protein [Massilia sp. CCM 9029]MDQ1835354.1 hypothetical protein [Massilia sp. CCM 9029]